MFSFILVKLKLLKDGIFFLIKKLFPGAESSTTYMYANATLLGYIVIYNKIKTPFDR